MNNLMTESIDNYANDLLEKKWGDYVDSIPNDTDKKFTAILLENTQRWMNRMDESTRTLNVGTFTKYIFPVVRAVVPNLIAQDIVSVQPMTGPTSQVFYFDILYGTAKGAVAKNQKLFDAQAGPSMVGNTFSADRVETEQVGLGNGTTGPTLTNAAFLPVIPRTLAVSAQNGTVTGVDDGSGNITGTGIASGTINYTTGALAITFSAVTTMSVPITVNYNYDTEALSSTNQPQTPELDILLTSVPVTAQKRRLRARWSLEAAQDLKALFGIDADLEVTSAMAEAIKAEVDREIINDLFTIAPSGAGTITTFDIGTIPSGVSFTEHKLKIIDHFVEGSNKIFSATKRSVGNWIVAGTDICSIIETLPGFVPIAGAQNQVGVVKIGNLNGRWDIFKDPYIATKDYLMGHKGSTFLDTGYVYAPYIPLYTTPTVVLDDFLGRKGVGSQYGKKVVNSRFYAKGSMTGTL